MHPWSVGNIEKKSENYYDNSQPFQVYTAPNAIWPEHEQFGSTGLLYLHHKEINAVVQHVALKNQPLKFVSHIHRGFKNKTKQTPQSWIVVLHPSNLQENLSQFWNRKPNGKKNRDEETEASLS